MGYKKSNRPDNNLGFRLDLGKFLFGALLASVPMSYLIIKSIHRQPEVILAKTVESPVQIEKSMLSSKTISPKEIEFEILTPSPTNRSENVLPSEETSKSTPKTAPQRTPNTTPLSQDVIILIEKYANQYAVDKDMMINIAKCESGFRGNAVNGPYAGIYQFMTSTWVSNRRAMGLDSNPNLRFNLEESIKTAAFKMSRDGFGAWPVCQSIARGKTL
jgi:hypothetical protein